MKKMLEEEKQQRAKIVASLKGTIQRVRDAGHEEDRLQSELLQLTTQLVQEKRKREQCEVDLEAANSEKAALNEQLASMCAQRLEAQQALKNCTLEVWQHHLCNVCAP
jgi:chromosome segregation ATPase